MKGFLVGCALAGFMAASAAAPAFAQSTTAQKVLSGPSAPLQKAMTERQARSQCQMEFKGAKGSKSALRTKMKFCIDQKTQGN